MTTHIEGYDFVRCEHLEGCATEIAMVEWDIDGPCDLQPDGFKCADHWTCNAHGDRETATCNDCIAEIALRPVTA